VGGGSAADQRHVKMLLVLSIGGACAGDAPAPATLGHSDSRRVSSVSDTPGSKRPEFPSLRVNRLYTNLHKSSQVFIISAASVESIVSQSEAPKGAAIQKPNPQEHQKYKAFLF
jgi:hypothetical protein